MIRIAELKYVPIAVLTCPCCTRKKKPFKSFRSLNVHLAKCHPEYPYKIELIEKEFSRSGNKTVRRDVIVRTKISRK